MSCFSTAIVRETENGRAGDLDAGPLRLLPTLQHYPWGDREYLPRMLGRDNPNATPFAELWMGAHPDSPAWIESPSGRVSLASLIERDPVGWLNPVVAGRFQGQLPYLFKVLAAAAPLSLQVHPSKEKAAAGFSRENDDGVPVSSPIRNYKDPNHKPELIVALTDFYGLCGFRPLREIAERIATVPELGEIALEFRPTSEALKEFYWRLMDLPQDGVDRLLHPLVRRLTAQGLHQSFKKTDPEYWLLRADQVYSHGGHCDRGLFSFYLLNLVRLIPGQAMFLPAGVLHAYLEGAGMEIMANSNNVLRGGLTSKHVDVPELLRSIVFEAKPVEIITAQQIADSAEWVYPTPAEEFELRRLEVSATRPYGDGPDHSADILLATSLEPGKTVTVTAGGHNLNVVQGDAFFIRPGLAYSIQANGQATLFKATVPHPPQTASQALSLEQDATFRGYAPVQLAFGTSGLRGLVEDITDLEAYLNTLGFLDYLAAMGDTRRGESVCIAGDLRPSTDGPQRSILRAVARAVEDAGLHLDYLGRLPTPALANYAMQRQQPSIMVTGSHIPFDRNGIKFNKSSGEILKEDEPAILRAIQRVRQIQCALPRETSLFGDDGMFKQEHLHPLPPANARAERDYLQRYADFFPAQALQGRRIVVYQHSAVGRDLLVELLTRLGAEVIAKGRSDIFIPVDTEAISDRNLELLQTMADEVCGLGRRIDAIVSTDGDGDRPLLAGIDPEGKVHFFGGDLVGMVVADYLGADAVVVPVSCNDAVDRWNSDRQGTLWKTRIGSPYVIKGMERLRQQGNQRIVGWEANGGFLTGSDLERHGRMLRKLPTRDAALPLLATLASAQEKQLTVVDLFGRLPRRFSKAGLIDKFPVETSRALLRLLLPDDPEITQIEFRDGSTQLAYGDGSERPASKTTAAQMRQIRLRLERHFSPSAGFDQVVRINTIDGVRVFFRNGDVAHVRSSGNAPQLRIYAVANSQQRADEIVRQALAEPAGILRRLETELNQEGETAALIRCIQKNIDLTRDLFARGETPEIIGTVAGSRPAQSFWQGILDQARGPFQARTALSFHEDLPTNQAFGLLLLWQRLREHRREGRGALVAFVFGDGIRSTPFTETDNGQKPAIATFVRESAPGNARFLSMVELAMRFFVPVQQFLRRSGFAGLVVKWGDEVQIPARDLSGTDSLFQEADVVRFVSMREIDAEGAKNKDWVGLDDSGHVTAFIPRRPLAAMEDLAKRGLVQRRENKLYGGINLGSIGVSYALLDCLLDEFKTEVNDPTARRSDRPALDPEFFTALTVAVMDDPQQRADSWSRAREESPDVEALHRRFPDLLDRLTRVIRSFRRKHHRPVKLVAMDFGDQYWGDIGQHTKIYEFYLGLNRSGMIGEITRAMAGLSRQRDQHGNLLVNSQVAPGVQVRNSVLLHVSLSGSGTVDNCVLIGTRAHSIQAQQAFDVLSTVLDLTIAPGGGTYKVVSSTPVHAGPGERLTTLFLPDTGPHLFRVTAETDLKDKANSYAQPILGNPLSFQQAHLEMSSAAIETIRQLRTAAEAQVLAAMPSPDRPAIVVSAPAQPCI